MSNTTEREHERRYIANTNDIRPVGNRRTSVFCLDEPGAGGMCHRYEVNCPPTTQRVAVIDFQKGPIQENGVNGCQNEDLILIVMDRLRGAQKGDFACRENAIALTKLEEALLWLNYRTHTRTYQGVEGKNEHHTEG